MYQARRVSVHIQLAPNFSLLGADWILGQTSYFEACVRGIGFVCFCDCSIGFLNCSDIVVYFVFHCIKVTWSHHYVVGNCYMTFINNHPLDYHYSYLQNWFNGFLLTSLMADMLIPIALLKHCSEYCPWIMKQFWFLA